MKSYQHHLMGKKRLGDSVKYI